MGRRGVWKRLTTTTVRDHADIQAHFDAVAPSYADAHGRPSRLLEYRLGVIRRLACIQPDERLLEVGCGDGMHLRALAAECAHATGVDISPGMIEVARQAAAGLGETIDFAVGRGEQLEPVTDASVDVAYCVGSLEHMLDREAVVRSAFRVLRSGGRFVCMTPNGGYIWYRFLARVFGLDTQHLSTDRFLTRRELTTLFGKAGFGELAVGHWTFIPRGDMHPVLGRTLDGLDGLGRLTGLSALRGGLVLCGRKP